jgi:hypothetical protein
MRFYVGITDRDWFEHVSQIEALDEINFWQPTIGERASGRGSCMGAGRRGSGAGGSELFAFSVAANSEPCCPANSPKSV